MSQSKDEYDDDNLEDLDSLLDELDDEVLSKPPGSLQVGAEAVVKEESKSDVNAPKSGGDGEVGVEDEFGAMMKEILQNDPTLAGQLKDFVQELQKQDQGDVTNSANGVANGAATAAAAAAATKGADGKSKNFEDIVSDTIQRLKTSGSSVDKQLKEEQDGAGDLLSQLLGQLGDLDLGEDGDGADGEGAGGFGDVLMDMLSQLTSKSVLYEPLKDLHVKFPAWLAENRGQLPDDKFKNYQDQYEVINDIIVKFELLDYNDKKDSKYINLKLESLQDLGMPPEEIMNSDLGLLPGFSQGAGTNEAADAVNEEDLEKQLEENCKQT